MPHVGRELRITRVTAWPAVGRSALVFFDDPHLDALEHWRQCSTIQSITRLAPGEPGEDQPQR
jgi:hypothetical protein